METGHLPPALYLVQAHAHSRSKIFAKLNYLALMSHGNSITCAQQGKTIVISHNCQGQKGKQARLVQKDRGGAPKQAFFSPWGQPWDSC